MNLNFRNSAIFLDYDTVGMLYGFFRKRNRFILPEVCFNDLKATNHYVNQTRYQLHISEVLHFDTLKY